MISPMISPRISPVRRVQIGFCGEWYDAKPESEFAIGRDGDLQIDDNPYLHRRFLSVQWHQELWWLMNVGSQL